MNCKHCGNDISNSFIDLSCIDLDTTNVSGQIAMVLFCEACAQASKDGGVMMCDDLLPATTISFFDATTCQAHRA